MKANTIYTKALNNNKDSLYELMYNVHDQLFQLGHVNALNDFTRGIINDLVNKHLYNDNRTETSKAMAIQYIYERSMGEIQ